MSTTKERIFVVGASGSIGSGVVRGLIEKGINTTAYVRDESKARDLFKNELVTGQLMIVVGSYSSTDVYAKAIEGHTRLFLLVVGDPRRATLMSEVKGIFGKIAYEKGVRQIVDLSSFTVRSYGRQSLIGYMHTTSEDRLWALVDDGAKERSLVVLRPGVFMSNQLMTDVRSVKHLNKIVSSASPNAMVAWIDTKDISDCAVVILTEPIEKHDRYVYEMGAEYLTHEERAMVFSKVLGRLITYEQQSTETLYKIFLDLGMAHSYAYDLISYSVQSTTGNVTPQLSILINRPLRTVEQWLQDNVKSFQ